MAIDAVGNVWGQVADDSVTGKDIEEMLVNAGVMAGVSVVTFTGWNSLKGLGKILGREAVEEVFGKETKEIVDEYVEKIQFKDLY